MKEKKNIINFDLFTAVEISVESKNEVQLFHQRVNDGYINATELCKNANKRFNDWQRLSTTDDFLSELSSVAGIPATELVQNSVTKKILVTASDGKNYDTIHYNLDMIIAVGYKM